MSALQSILAVQTILRLNLHMRVNNFNVLNANRLNLHTYNIIERKKFQ